MITRKRTFSHSTESSKDSKNKQVHNKIKDESYTYLLAIGSKTFVFLKNTIQNKILQKEEHMPYLSSIFSVKMKVNYLFLFQWLIISPGISVIFSF